METGLVSIEFVGLADPLIAEINRVIESLRKAKAEVASPVPVLNTNEASYTSTVAAESTKRKAVRKTEQAEAQRASEESIKRTKAEMQAQIDANILATKSAGETYEATRRFEEKRLVDIRAFEGGKIASERTITANVEENSVKRETAYKAEVTAAKLSSEEIERNRMAMQERMTRADAVAEAERLEQEKASAAKYDRIIAEEIERQKGMNAALKRAGLPSRYTLPGETTPYEGMYGIRAGLTGIGRMGQAIESPFSGGLSGAAGFLASVAPFPTLLGHPEASAAIVGGAGGLAWVYEVVKHGGEFQKTLAQMSAQTEVTGKDLEEFGLKGRDLAKTFGSEAKDNVDSFRLLINAFGLDLGKNKDVLFGMTETVNKFALAAGISVPEATETLRSTFNDMGFSINGPGGAAQALKDFNMNADILASGAIRGQVQLDQMRAAMIKAGGVASRFDVDMRDAVAAIEVLGKVGAPGSDTGTALRNTLIYLGNAGQNKRTVKDLGAIGLKPEQINPARVGFEPALVNLKKAMDATNDTVAKNNVIADIGKNRWQSYLDMMLKNMPLFEQFRKEIGKGGEVAEMAATQMDTVVNREARLAAKVKDVLLGSFSKDAFNALLSSVDSLASGLVSAEPLLLEGTKALAGVFDIGVKLAKLALAPISLTVNVAEAGVSAANELLRRGTQSNNASADLSRVPGMGGEQQANSEIYSKYGKKPPISLSEIQSGHSIPIVETPFMREARRVGHQAVSMPTTTESQVAPTTPPPPTTHHITGAEESTRKKALKAADQEADQEAEDRAIKAYSNKLLKLSENVDNLSDAEVKTKREQAELDLDTKLLAIKKGYGQHSAQVDREIAEETLRIAVQGSDAKAKAAADAEKEEEKQLTDHWNRMVDFLGRSEPMQKKISVSGQNALNEAEDRNNNLIQDSAKRQAALEDTSYRRERDRIIELSHNSELTKAEREAYYKDLDSLDADYNNEVANRSKSTAEQAQESVSKMESALQSLSGSLSSSESSWQNWGQAIGIVVSAMLEHFLSSATTVKNNASIISGLSANMPGYNASHDNFMPLRSPHSSFESAYGIPGLSSNPTVYPPGLFGNIPAGWPHFSSTPLEEYVGGYTGPGGKYIPAGIVHRGEYVFDQDTVNKIGVDNLDALRRATRGYNGGGTVGDLNLPAFPAMSGDVPSSIGGVGDLNLPAFPAMSEYVPSSIGDVGGAASVANPLVGQVLNMLPGLGSQIAGILSYKAPADQWNWNGSKKPKPKHSEIFGILDAILPAAASLIPGVGPFLAPLVSVGLNMAGINANEKTQGLFSGMAPFSSGKQQGLASMLGLSSTGGQLFGGELSAEVGALGGASGIMKMLGGLSSGGFTGVGGKYEPAGIVHRGEYVFDQDTVAKVGLNNLIGLHRAYSGYSSGGYVDGGTQQHDSDNALIPHLMKLDKSIQNLKLNFTTGDAQTLNAVGEQRINLISL